MASIGPREIDLGWMIYIHRFFQDLVEDLGLPGHAPRPAAGRRWPPLYEALTGYEPQDLDFYTAYAALRHGIVMFRITRRSIRFGEAEMPEDPDHAIMHHAHLRTNARRRLLGRHLVGPVRSGAVRCGPVPSVSPRHRGDHEKEDM